MHGHHAGRRPSRPALCAGTSRVTGKMLGCASQKEKPVPREREGFQFSNSDFVFEAFS
jgi:hypothetical protein